MDYPTYPSFTCTQLSALLAYRHFSIECFNLSSTNEVTLISNIEISESDLI